MIKDLYSTLLDIGTKVYFFDVRENERGKFLKIVEKRDERREQIIIPEERIEDFHKKFLESSRVLAQMAAADHVPESVPVGPVPTGEPPEG